MVSWLLPEDIDTLSFALPTLVSELPKFVRLAALAVQPTARMQCESSRACDLSGCLKLR